MASYGAGERVELRVLHIPRNGSQSQESGLYYTVNAELAVEDSTNGGISTAATVTFFNSPVVAGKPIPGEIFRRPPRRLILSQKSKRRRCRPSFVKYK